MKDHEEFSQPVQIYSVDHSQKELHINLNAEIKEPYQYGDLNQHLRSLGPEDLVHLHINNPGGALDAAIELAHNLEKCAAQTIGYLGADASSAGSLIFLACDNWIIHDLSTMMVHNASGGSVGTVPNMITRVDHLQKLMEKVFDKYYRGFLTDNEIEDHLKGCPDQYLFAEDIKERLENLSEYRQKEFEKYQQQLEAEQDEYESQENDQD